MYVALEWGASRSSRGERCGLSDFEALRDKMGNNGTQEVLTAPMYTHSTEQVLRWLKYTCKDEQALSNAVFDKIGYTINPNSNP